MEDAHPPHFFLPPPSHHYQQHPHPHHHHNEHQQQQQPSSSSSSMPRSHSSPSLSSFAGESSYSGHPYTPTRSRLPASRSSSSGSSSSTSMLTDDRYTPPLPADHPHLSTYSIPPAPGFLHDSQPYSPPQQGMLQPQPMHAPIAPAPQRVRPQEYARHPQHHSSPPLFGTGDSLLGPAGEEDQLVGFGSSRRRGGRLYHSNPLPTQPQRYQHYMNTEPGDMPSVPTPPSLSPTLGLSGTSFGPPPSSSSSGPPQPHSSSGIASEQHFYGHRHYHHQQQQPAPQQRPHHHQGQHQHQHPHQSHASTPPNLYGWDAFTSSDDNKYPGER